MTDWLVTLRRRSRMWAPTGGRTSGAAHRPHHLPNRPAHHEGLSQSAVAVLGLEGVATVVAVRPTHDTVDGLDVLELDLVVLVDRHPPVPVTRREPVLSHLVGRAQPGARLRVKVDPDRFANLYLDWHWYPTM